LLLVVAMGLVATITACHALIHKREPSAAAGWIAVCLLFPLVGPILYIMLGFNRIQMRARRLGTRRGPVTQGESANLEVPTAFAVQARISHAVTALDITAGNAVTPLRDGENAYPVMLEAIESAHHHIFLATYIFESNQAGQAFADALQRAHERGVDVRVLLDGAGEWYSWPRIRRRLSRAGVRVARFLPPQLIPPRLLLNLRNHRKILVVDGHTAFTGGMNIGDRHYASQGGARDIHFRIAGPVAEQIEAVFLQDWDFTTGEISDHPDTELAPDAGSALCRTVVNGPNEDLGRLTMILVGAAAAAQERLVIVTPYFLPPRELVGTLQAAAVRGTRVDIILPAHNNLPFVHWATQNMLWELVEWGVNVYYRDGQFAHSKLFLVDNQYSQVGSANMDPRSLRLNFELTVEVYDRDLTANLTEEVDTIIAGSRRVTLASLNDRSLPVRLRDAFCWLFMPYL
jgi:cardiolipin synthase